MIRSMTAFGNAKADLEQGTLALELRSVNSRFLDLYFRLPDELRHVETLRELLTAQLARGKVEIRVSFTRNASADMSRLDPAWLETLSEQLQAARRILPDIASPRLVELFNWPGQRGNDALDPQVWGAACLQAAQQALTQLQEGREREGQRLAAMMRECADGVGRIVETVESHLPHCWPSIARSWPPSCARRGNRLPRRLQSHLGRRAVRTAGPGSQSVRAAHRRGRRAVATALASGRTAPPAGRRRRQAGVGQEERRQRRQRLDFLFQEMNREANTLGSKAGSMDVTRAAMDLKLLIEQMREQAQNIE